MRQYTFDRTFTVAPLDLLLVDTSATVTRCSKGATGPQRREHSADPRRRVQRDDPGRGPESWRAVAGDADGNLYLSEGGLRVTKLASKDVAQKGTFLLTPALTLRARSEDANASFQTITVH